MRASPANIHSKETHVTVQSQVFNAYFVLSFSQGWFSGEVETAAEEKTETEHEVQHQTEWQSHDASPLPSK